MNKMGRVAKPGAVNNDLFKNSMKILVGCCQLSCLEQTAGCGQVTASQEKQEQWRLSLWLIFILPCHYQVKKSGCEGSRP